VREAAEGLEDEAEGYASRSLLPLTGEESKAQPRFLALQIMPAWNEPNWFGFSTPQSFWTSLGSILVTQLDCCSQRQPFSSTCLMPVELGCICGPCICLQQRSLQLKYA